MDLGRGFTQTIKNQNSWFLVAEYGFQDSRTVADQGPDHAMCCTQSGTSS